MRATISCQHQVSRDFFGRSSRKCRISDELDRAVHLLDQRGAALHPIAAVVISHTGQLMNGATMNVSAQNRVDVELPGVTQNRFFEFADKVDRVFNSLFRVGAERPVTETKSPAEKVDRRIEREQKLITDVAKIREPLRVLHHGVELVSVND